MEVTAKLRNLRTSPKKVRLVVDMVRGMSVPQAVAQLQFSTKGASRPVLKLIQSAAANAENNNKLDPNAMVISKIFVDEGPTLKRWRARAFGRAAAIRKRTSHITVILDDGKGEESASVREKTVEEKAESRSTKSEKNKKSESIKEEKKTSDKKAAKKSTKKDNKESDT